MVYAVVTFAGWLSLKRLQYKVEDEVDKLYSGKLGNQSILSCLYVKQIDNTLSLK